ncbi:LPXTG cell wall anchor domain-containing protein [Actinomyces sp. oral taxon 448]|uniref:LPXTG cell wall anchor domain-containing protein n=1 Tax=Actinomyces sp. oral taxon 448 TaxID=712124 RepID=UPI00031BD98B|nr:LPXTG cell wall anchor domain-containing protein [Actinomyces sp. oral taxon 448]
MFTVIPCQNRAADRRPLLVLSLGLVVVLTPVVPAATARADAGDGPGAAATAVCSGSSEPAPALSAGTPAGADGPSAPPSAEPTPVRSPADSTAASPGSAPPSSGPTGGVRPSYPQPSVAQPSIGQPDLDPSPDPGAAIPAGAGAGYDGTAPAPAVRPVQDQRGMGFLEDPTAEPPAEPVPLVQTPASLSAVPVPASQPMRALGPFASLAQTGGSAFAPLAASAAMMVTGAGLVVRRRRSA